MKASALHLNHTLFLVIISAEQINSATGK